MMPGGRPASRYRISATSGFRQLLCDGLGKAARLVMMRGGPRGLAGQAEARYPRGKDVIKRARQGARAHMITYKGGWTFFLSSGPPIDDLR